MGMRRRQRQTPRRGQADIGELPDHRRQHVGSQPFLQRPQHVSLACGCDEHQLARDKAETGQRRRIELATFAQIS